MRQKRYGFDPWIRKIPWRKAWQSTPVFLLGKPSFTEEPGGLQSIELQRVGYYWNDLAHILIYALYTLWMHATNNSTQIAHIAKKLLVLYLLLLTFSLIIWWAETIFSSILQTRNWGPESLSNFPKITQRASGRVQAPDLMLLNIILPLNEKERKIGEKERKKEFVPEERIPKKNSLKSTKLFTLRH